MEYRKVCLHCEREVLSEEIVKGYECERGRFVVIAERDLKRILTATNRSIAILDFIHREVNLTNLSKLIWPDQGYTK